MSEEKSWYVAEGDKPTGPLSREELLAGIEAGRYNDETQVFQRGMVGWKQIRLVPELAGNMGLAELPPPPATTFHRGSLAHEIDFEILGEEMQFVEIELDPEESVIAEAGGMMYMSAGIEMETIFGDGSAQGGLMGKLLGAGKRLITGESLFMTLFTNKGAGKQHVAFAAPYPGKIIPFNLAELGGEIICQKDAFLCAAKGVSVGIAFQKKIGVGLFGGEGFIMQRLEGDGLAFAHAGGTIVSKTLKAGESLRVDTGCLVALEKGVDYDIQFVGGIKSAIFGGEGLFFARLTGPGTVWLQSLPFSRLADRIFKAAPQAGGKDKGEGSLLGGIANVFESRD